MVKIRASQPRSCRCDVNDHGAATPCPSVDREQTAEYSLLQITAEQGYALGYYLRAHITSLLIPLLKAQSSINARPSVPGLVVGQSRELRFSASCPVLPIILLFFSFRFRLGAQGAAIACCRLTIR